MIVENPVSETLLELVKKKLKKDEDPERPKKKTEVIVNPEIGGNTNPSGPNSAPDISGNTRLATL